MGRITTSQGELALLPIQPSNNAEETLEFLTDLFVSRNGTEHATQVRRHPRQVFTYTFNEQARDKVSSFITQFGALGLNWAVPLWMEEQTVVNVAPGNVVIDCQTDIFDFRAGSFALLYASPDQWELLEVSGVGASSLTVNPVVGNFVQAILIPVHLGTIVNDIRRGSSGFRSSTRIRFELTTNVSRSGTLPVYNQYKGLDFITDIIYKRSSEYQQDLQTRIDRVDFDLGVFEKERPWENNRVIRQEVYYNNSLEEHHNFKLFLIKRAGRRFKYWSPSFENDLRNISSGLLTTLLTVENDGLGDWTQTHNNIAIRLKNGIWLPREILSSQNLVSSSILTLNEPLNIQANEIEYISFISRRRFNTDRIVVSWLGNCISESLISTVGTPK